VLHGVTPLTIGEQHEALFARGIYTKSMLKTYFNCPVQFEQRYIYGRKEAPGWALGMGLTMHDLMEVWGTRKLSGEPLSEAEARQLLSDRWNVRMAGLIPQVPKDQQIDRFIQLYRDWLATYKTLSLGQLVAVEKTYGEEGDVKLGVVPIAGHPDTEWTRGPGDYKIVKSTSQYRKIKQRTPWANTLEHVFAATLTGKDHSALFPFIHDFKTRRKPWVEENGLVVNERHRSVVTEAVERAVAAIGRGDFPANPRNIGQFPCTPDYCGFFGTCPVTRGLTRKDCK
jgi:hypothetical protein